MSTRPLSGRPLRTGGASAYDQPCQDLLSVSRNGGCIVTESLGERDAIPFVIQPAQDGIDLAQWAASNRPLIDELLAKHKSLLFRDFQIKTADEFHEFVRKTSNSSLLEYRDRSTPRETRGERVYTSTVYPAHSGSTCITRARTGEPGRSRSISFASRRLRKGAQRPSRT